MARSSSYTRHQPTRPFTAQARRETFRATCCCRPPNNVSFEVPEPIDANARDRFSAHSADPSCTGCHRLMDPIGFGSSHSTPWGLPRSERRPSTRAAASGERHRRALQRRGDLAEKLAESEEVKSCYARVVSCYAYGRAEASEDACAVDQIETAFSKSNGSVKALLLSLTQTTRSCSAAGSDVSRIILRAHLLKGVGGASLALPLCRASAATIRATAIEKFVQRAATRG